MFRQTKKYKKNKRNITKKKHNKKNHKKVFKKRYTRKHKVKRKVRSTRKNLRGGAQCYFYTLLEDSFREYNANNNNNNNNNNNLTKKTDGHGGYYIYIPEDIKKKGGRMGNHIHYGCAFMGFPSGSGGYQAEGAQVRTTGSNCVTKEDVQRTINYWITLADQGSTVGTGGLKNKKVWIGLFTLMLEKLHNNNKYTQEKNTCINETPSVDTEENYKGPEVANLLKNYINELRLPNEKPFTNLCFATINNLKDTKSQFVHEQLETIKKQLTLLKNVIPPDEEEFKKKLYKYILLRAWCKNVNKFNITGYEPYGNENNFINTYILPEANSEYIDQIKSKSDGTSIFDKLKSSYQGMMDRTDETSTSTPSSQIISSTSQSSYDRMMDRTDEISTPSPSSQIIPSTSQSSKTIGKKKKSKKKK